jgi:hypothetical protein
MRFRLRLQPFSSGSATLYDTGLNEVNKVIILDIVRSGIILVESEPQSCANRRFDFYRNKIKIFNFYFFRSYLLNSNIIHIKPEEIILKLS